MGDAGPPSPPSRETEIRPNSSAEANTEPLNVREVRVLVTGFGPFKAFVTNPSWLIVSALSKELQPRPNPKSRSRPSPDVKQESVWDLSETGDAQLCMPQVVAPHTATPLTPSTPLNTATDTSPGQTESQKADAEPYLRKHEPYRIIIHTHPEPIKVAYSAAATIVPALLREHEYDFIFHIGLAAGRASYTLETVANRDEYKIKDVDDRDGWVNGEYVWKQEGIPETLHVKWNSEDVLHRWRTELKDREAEAEANEKKEAAAKPITATNAEPADPANAFWARGPEQQKHRVKKRQIHVKLSQNAGRFLCEFLFFESLSRRWLQKHGSGKSTSDEKNSKKVGKAAFLHVPCGTAAADVARGVVVAESAILALVESWEEGYRNEQGNPPVNHDR